MGNTFDLFQISRLHINYPKLRSGALFKAQWIPVAGRELSSELIESPAGDRQLSSELAESPIDAAFLRMINWYSYSSRAVDGGRIN